MGLGRRRFSRTTCQSTLPAGRPTLDAANLRGREVKLVAHIKTKVSGAANQGNCLLRVERPKGKLGFVENMQNRPIQSSSWKEVEIAGKVDADAERVVFGCALSGAGEMWVDEIQLHSKNATGQWERVAIKNAGFEESAPQTKPAGWNTPRGGYVFQVTESNPYRGKHCLSITSAHTVGSFAPIGWSADGKYVYAFDSAGGRKVSMVRADGAEVKPLGELFVNANSSIESAAITPDGQRIVYSANQVRSDVWIVENFDGGVR
jgi:hypothetical protein